MKKLLYVALISVFVVGGCSNEKNDKIVCTAQNEVIEITNTVEYSGDTVKKQTILEKTSLTKIGQDKKTIKNAMEETKKLYSIEGVSFKYSIDKEGNVEGTTIVDFSTANLEKLEDIGLISNPDPENEIKRVSFQETKGILKEYGYTCK